MGKKNKKRSRGGAGADNDTHKAVPSPEVNAEAGKSVASSDCVQNPFLEKHRAFLASSCTQTERDNFFSNEGLDPDRRGEIWMNQADIGEELINSYAWAIPDERAIRILRHFSPLVEIGCGANAYWCRLMAQSGIDVIGYDENLQAGGKIPSKTKNEKQTIDQVVFHARKGGPEVLDTKDIKDSNRTLFLCYTDEDNSSEPQEQEAPQSLASKCLEYYSGQYIVHVGELYGDTTSMEQAPWGRSSGPDFQQRLASEFHCLLRAGLPNWVHVRDTISVWKRSETCSIVLAAEEDDEEGDEELEYKHIPAAERLPTDLAAPCLKHLLDKSGHPEEKKEQPLQKQLKKERADKKQETKQKADKKQKKAKNGEAQYQCPW